MSLGNRNIRFKIICIFLMIFVKFPRILKRFFFIPNIQIINNALLEYAIMPCIFNGFIYGSKGKTVSITMGLYLLVTILKHF